MSEGRGSQLLIGSTRNCVLIGSLDVGFSPAVLGHTDELWALAPHPSLSQFLTAGFDKIVQLWDSMSRSVVWSKDIAVSLTHFVLLKPDKNSTHLCSISLRAEMPLNVFVIVSPSYILERRVNDCECFKEQAQSAAFSPDGSVIVIGSVSGRWLVMDSETRETYSVHTDGMEPIQASLFKFIFIFLVKIT